MEYALLMYGDEKRWEQVDAATRTQVYAAHTEFSRLLAEHGHKMTGGAELRGTATARTLRRSTESVSVTDGPFAETTEQLGGFYLVETDDIDDVVKLAGMISFGESIEVRAVVPSSEQS